jgi:hypothetical protein
MPFIEAKLMDESCSLTQKMDAGSRFTDAMNSAGREKHRVGWATIEEICSGDWSIGGTAMIPDAVRVPTTNRTKNIGGKA